MKKLMIAYVSILYVMQIFYMATILMMVWTVRKNPYAINPFIPLGIGIFFGLIALTIGVGHLILGLRQSYSPTSNICRFTMLSKISLIPFFILNFVICFLFVAGAFNPFLIWSLFIIVPIMVFLTYLVLLTTSSYNIGYLMYKVRKKECTLAFGIWYSIFHLIFCIDVFASIVLYYNEKKYKTLVN